MATTKTRRVTDERKTGSQRPASNQAQGEGAVRKAVGEATARAQSLASRAKDEVRSYFDDKKEQVATTLEDFGEVTRQAAQTLRDREDTKVANYAELAAEQVEAFSHYLRGLQPAKVVRDIEAAARRQPALVYGGLFLAGIVISRFLRASERSEDSEYEYEDQFQGTQTALDANLGRVRTPTLANRV